MTIKCQAQHLPVVPTGIIRMYSGACEEGGEVSCSFLVFAQFLVCW